MSTIRDTWEQERGCGFRQPGGLYLVSGPGMAICGKLPIPLETCPACGHGIKFSRGWTWVNAKELTKDVDCRMEKDHEVTSCDSCPLGHEAPRSAGLLWVGKKFYSVGKFLSEAAQMGISKRIAGVPRGFKVGETLVLLAHLEAIYEDEEASPGIFGFYIPQRVEYVVSGDEPEEKLFAMERRGVSLVRVHEAQPSIPALEPAAPVEMDITVKVSQDDIDEKIREIGQPNEQAAEKLEEQGIGLEEKLFAMERPPAPVVPGKEDS